MCIIRNSPRWAKFGLQQSRWKIEIRENTVELFRKGKITSDIISRLSFRVKWTFSKLFVAHFSSFLFLTRYQLYICIATAAAAVCVVVDPQWRETRWLWNYRWVSLQLFFSPPQLCYKMIDPLPANTAPPTRTMRIWNMTRTGTTSRPSVVVVKEK